MYGPATRTERAVVRDGRFCRRHGAMAALAPRSRRVFGGWATDPNSTGIERVAPIEEAGWAPHIGVASGVALVVAAVASGLSLDGYRGATLIFWAAFGLIVVPTTCRVAWPAVSRTERLWLLNMFGVVLYLTRLLSHPTGFYGHDEYLHWSTAIDILERHHLFTINALLPISPAYPALEVVTAALVQLTGFSVFICAVLLVIVFRVLCVSAVFLIFEKISGSSWVGALATIIYMTGSNFYAFLVSYSYETIALDFLFVGLFLAVLVGRDRSTERWRIGAVSAPIFFAVAVSHHLTSWIGVLFLCAVALAALFRGDRAAALATAAVFGVAILSVGFWTLVSGNAADSYVDGIFSRSFGAFFSFLSGAHHGRALFTGADGVKQPVAYRIVGILTVLLTSTGLVVGFFRSLYLPRGGASSHASSPKPGRTGMFLGMRDNPWAIVFTVSSFAFPPSILLRLTSGGWELGNRMAAFVYLGVSLVIAVGAATVLIGPHPSRVRAAVVGLFLSLMLAGGIIAGLPPDLVAPRYIPAADGTSIEPMGVAAARWTRRWLGEGWRFASDRSNRLLLATYAVQRIVTQEQDGEALGHVMFDRAYFGAEKKPARLSEENMNALRRAGVDFLLVDLRLQSRRPLWGYYFDAGEDADLSKSPPLGVDLEKFDRFPRVGRIFDNGYEVIYDVRGLLEAQPMN